VIFKKKHKHAKTSPKLNGFKPPVEMHSDIIKHRVAIVLDEEIQEIITTESRLAALLLSEPKFIEITDSEIEPRIGWKYNQDTREFSNNNEENTI
jgi:hypothetical protein